MKTREAVAALPDVSLIAAVAASVRVALGFTAPVVALNAGVIASPITKAIMRQATVLILPRQLPALFRLLTGRLLSVLQ